MTVKLPITEMNRFHDEWTLRYAFRTNVILYKATLLKKKQYMVCFEAWQLVWAV